MYEKGLVNIITPSYNSAHLIPHLLDSILAQTYPHISMFVIDDGSTDNTKEVIYNYIPLFTQKGYRLQYVYQPNGGQSAAINNGLKLVTGEFLAWPDSDDWYKTDDAIETMVTMLQKTNDNVGLVRCQIEFISEQTLLTERSTAITPCDKPNDLMDEAIYQTNSFFYAPIGWMVKTKYLDAYIPNRDIYVDKCAGQNAQMLLPYIANSKCVTSEKVLANYLVRKDSHSRERRDYQIQMEYYEAQLNCFISTLRSIKAIPLNKMLIYVQAKQEFYYKLLMDLDYSYNNIRNFRRHYKTCMSLNIPVETQYKCLYRWTNIYSIKSYKMMMRVINRLRKLYK